MWMSHGDSVTTMPPGFELLAHTENTPCAAIANHERKLYGVQFHPEGSSFPGGSGTNSQLFTIFVTVNPVGQQQLLWKMPFRRFVLKSPIEGCC